MMETYNFDVEPLSFSDHDNGADCFDDFDLDGSIGRALFDSNSDDASDDDILDRMFKEDSKTNDDLEAMFLDAEIDESYRRSSSMMMADYTRTDDTNTSSRIRLESLLETQYNPCRTTHRRAIIKDEQLVDDVNFLNPAETIFTTPTNNDNNVEKSNKRKKKSREDYRKNRRVSCSDLDSMRFDDHTSYKQPTTPHDHVVTPKPHRRVTVDCAAPSLSQLFGHHHDYDNNRHSSHAGILQELPAASVVPHPTTPPTPTIEYHEALQKLAASMKRSELSRRQVMMHRQHDYQAHQTREHVVTTIEQQLRQQAGCVATEQHYNTSQPHTIQQDDRSCIMSAFFSGSRGTLTNGLEHSRMQLKMYSALMRRESL